LRDAGRRDDRIVAKNAAEVVFVGKNLVLERQKYPGAVHQVDKWRPVFKSDALSAQDLLAGHRKEGARFHGGVIGDHHDTPPRDHPSSRDHPRRGRAAPFAIHVPRGPQAQLKEGCIRIEELVDAFPRREPPFGMLALNGLGPAALEQGLLLAVKIFD
jgi:hypothetical protein